MSENEELIFYILPSLVSTLLNRERAKGIPLTEKEVIEIRDNCQAIALPPVIARSMDKSRGYQDIDPENCWEEWQNVRGKLQQVPEALTEHEELQKARKELAEMDAVTTAEPLAKYLGRPALDFISSPPFDAWVFETLDDDDEPGSGPSYDCAEHGLALRCAGDGTINTIFLKANNDNSAFSNLSFASSRSDVLKLFGNPSKSGAAYKHAILGDYGPWDRFDGTICTLHVEYKHDVDEIKMLTFMRPDVVP